MTAVGSLVAPGGRLVVIQAIRGEGEVVDGPPWPLTETEMRSFAGRSTGLDLIRLEVCETPADSADPRASTDPAAPADRAGSVDLAGFTDRAGSAHPAGRRWRAELVRPARVERTAAPKEAQ